MLEVILKNGRFGLATFVGGQLPLAVFRMNLIRLQRCLQSSTLEAVRCRLLCPANVPHVIRNLRMRYSRSESFICSMTERVRRLPYLRTNELNGIIEFGLAVDNLVQHLKNAGQKVHLSNPSLLHDLVGKLPVDYKIKWSAYKSMRHNLDLSTFGEFMSTSKSQRNVYLCRHIRNLRIC